MKKELSAYYNLFTDNYKSIKKSFKNKYSKWYPIASNTYTSKKIIVNPSRVLKCQNLIKEHEGYFSILRGVSFFPLTTMISTERNPKDFWINLKKTHDKLCTEFPRSNYLPLISYILLKKEIEITDRLILRAKWIYNEMKKDFPLKITPENYLYAFLSAQKSENDHQNVKKIKDIYSKMIDRLPTSRNLLILCQLVSVFPDEQHEKLIENIVNINEILENKNLKIGTGKNIITLGILASFGDNAQEIADNICEVYKELRGQKGFRFFKMSKSTCIMYSSMVVANLYKDISDVTFYNVIISNSLISYSISNQSD